MMMMNSNSNSPNPQNYYSSFGSMLKTNTHVKNKAKKRNLDQMGGSVFKKSKKNEVFSYDRPMKQIQDLQKLILWRGGVLRWLIEYNIVERGSTVSYLSRKGGRVMKKGRVYEDGIKCDCCDHMFLLTKFELHAGSTKHRAAAYLFFDDKRSILDCQTQLQTVLRMLPADDTKSVVTDVKSTKSSDYVMDTNDDYCSFCNDTGELLLCDSCTSSFHLTCIGLDRLPADSDLWLCCACACQICHQGQPSSLTKEGDSKDNDLIKCAQITTSKDLWVLCQAYGKVVDVFIPNRKSKAGKRFAFIHFIKVENLERLVDVPEVIQCSDVNSFKNAAVNNVEDIPNVNVEEESDCDVVLDTFFGDSKEVPMKENENNQSVNDKEVSKDPFAIYEILNRSKEVQEEHHKSASCSSRVFEEVENSDIYVQSEGKGGRPVRKEGGSILDALDDMIKVGQTMGFTMDGCTNDMEKIIGSNREHEGSQ
nr:increased DNA methylation 1-like [Tanacetum cinerariifolium]